MGAKWLRKRVTVKFDPFHLEEVELWHKGVHVKNVGLARIGEYNETQKIPCEVVEKAGRSRVLDVYAHKEQERFKQRYGTFKQDAATKEQGKEKIEK